MATSGTLITKQSIVDDYYTYVRNPAYNAIVFWSGSNPGSSRINTAVLGARDFTDNLSTTDITGTTLSITAIVNQVKAFAYYTTVARRARSGYITDNFDPDTAPTTTDDRTDICRLTDAYLINYTYNATLSNQVAAANIVSFFNAIRTTASQAQTTQAVLDLRVCHSSCHSSCHGSRGRR